MNNYIKIGNKLKSLEPYIYFDGILNLFILIVNIKKISRLENIKNIDKLIIEIKKMGFFYYKLNKETLYVSKTKENLEKGLYYDLNLLDDYKFGEMLGFPKCCIKKFGDFGGVRDNNIFEYIKNTDCLNNSSSYLNIFENKLIYHIPCSFNCKESINIGKKIINLYLILIRNNKIDKDFLLMKKKYILFKNLEWICISENGYSYGNLFNHKNIKSNKYIKKIKEGCSINILGNNNIGLEIDNDIVSIDEYVLLNFN